MGIAKVMATNAAVLIILGIYGYFASGSATALIAPAIGVVLFLLSFPVKKDNRTAAHIGVALTLISTVMFFFIGLKRSNLIVLVMAVFTLLALVFYIMDFMKRKKEREAA
jgi:Ca2+/Na+ antiporter